MAPGQVAKASQRQQLAGSSSVIRRITIPQGVVQKVPMPAVSMVGSSGKINLSSMYQ